MTNSNSTTGNKIVLLGDSGVGKTCIISRFISSKYEEDINSTNGASYASKKIEYPHLNKTLVLDIWDTAGQEKYKSLTKFFYKDAEMIILVYDITTIEPFDNIKNYWHKEVEQLAGKNVILGIVGNKCDLYDDEAVPEYEARKYAKSINAIYALTSAQNNFGISELFKNIGNKYLDPNFQEKVQSSFNTQIQNKGITLDKGKFIEKNKKHKKKKNFC